MLLVIQVVCRDKNRKIRSKKLILGIGPKNNVVTPFSLQHKTTKKEPNHLPV